jgi:hypothetical protein
MLFILNNHIFKINKKLNVVNLVFILREKKNLLYYINTKLKDRNFTYIEIYDIKDYPILEGT